ncbi:hypothetical protein ANTPLA_LOCUS3506 [Anthophora plagiata]
MPPSSVLLTRYRTARRYPVICRGSTTLCHGVALLFARCSASASAGAAVKWCQQFNIEKQVRAGYYTTQEGIHVWRCDKPGIFVPISDSRVKLSKTDRFVFAFAYSRMYVATSYEQGIVLCSKTNNETSIRSTSGGTVNSYPDSNIPNNSKYRSFSISATAERKQQNVVTRSRGAV